MYRNLHLMPRVPQNEIVRMLSSVVPSNKGDVAVYGLFSTIVP